MSFNNTAINTAIITISDTRRPQNDVSGERLAQLAEGAGCNIVEKLIVTDELDDVKEALLRLVKPGNVDLVLTTGGTGFAPRDNTPEATLAVIEREAPGIAEAIRRESAVKTPMAMLSRGIAGIAGKTLIINLPGSPKAVEECFEVIRPVLGHAVDLVRGETEHRKAK
jgi:molybdopterin adenylyltransferase